MPPRPWTVGIAAAKANFLPGLILWAAGMIIIVAWLTWPPAQHVLQYVGDLKKQYGFVYSVIATAFFAGALPFFMQRLACSKGERHDLPMLAFLVIFWGYKGIEVDALYRLQSLVFGNSHAPQIIAVKIFFDQFIYCTFWAVPTTVLPTAWAQAGFRKDVLLEPFRGWPRLDFRGFRQWYAWKVIPVLISNWAVWIPAVAMIYAMPLELQLPIQNLVCCLWVLMMLFMTKPAEVSAEH